MFSKAPFFMLMQVVSALNLLLEALLDLVMAQRHFKTEIRTVVGKFHAYHGLLNFSLRFYCHVTSNPVHSVPRAWCSASQAGVGPCSPPSSTLKQLMSPGPRVILDCLTQGFESKLRAGQ